MNDRIPSLYLVAMRVLIVSSSLGLGGCTPLPSLARQLAGSALTRAALNPLTPGRVHIGTPVEITIDESVGCF